jgi:hypothetical protein
MAHPPTTCTEHNELKPCEACAAILDELRLPNPRRREEIAGELHRGLL